MVYFESVDGELSKSADRLEDLPAAHLGFANVSIWPICDSSDDCLRVNNI